MEEARSRPPASGGAVETGLRRRGCGARAARACQIGSTAATAGRATGAEGAHTSPSVKATWRQASAPPRSVRHAPHGSPSCPHGAKRLPQGDGLPAVPTEQGRRGSDGASTHTWHVCPQPSGSGSHAQTWTSPVRQTTTLANATTAAALSVIILQIVRLICMPRTSLAHAAPPCQQTRRGNFHRNGAGTGTRRPPPLGVRRGGRGWRRRHSRRASGALPPAPSRTRGG